MASYHLRMKTEHRNAKLESELLRLEAMEKLMLASPDQEISLAGANSRRVMPTSASRIGRYRALNIT